MMIHPIIIFLLLATTTTVPVLVSASGSDDDHRHYVLIGVSGGLQEGFPANSKLHYNGGGDGEEVGAVTKAIFLGRGLVRGYKSFLDLMEFGWREYRSPASEEAVINCNVFATGCYEHANQYWLYLVDNRHVMSVLQNEPRYLSMTPDTGSIELAAEETSPLVRDFLKVLLLGVDRGANMITNVALPLVTGVYFSESSHIVSPPIKRHDDGTLVTNFPDSLALWAKVNDTDRTALLNATKACTASSGTTAGAICGSKDSAQDCPPSIWVDALEAEKRYWKGIRLAIQNAEEQRRLSPENKLYSDHALPPWWKCKKKIRFGVDNDVTSTRVNYPLSMHKIKSVLQQIGYQVDFDRGEIEPLQHKQAEVVEEPELDMRC